MGWYGIQKGIRKTFACLDLQCFNMLYKSLVRPSVEYGVTVWFPYKVKDIEDIEKVQKRATKQVKQIRKLSYCERLKKLNFYRHLDTDDIVGIWLKTSRYCIISTTRTLLKDYCTFRITEPQEDIQWSLVCNCNGWISRKIVLQLELLNRGTLYQMKS